MTKKKNNLIVQAALIIGVFDSGSGSNHESQVIEILKKNLKCTSCQIKSYPLYEKDGKVTKKRVLEQIKVAEKDQVQIWNFSWNISSSKDTEEIENKLNEITELPGALVVGSAGSKKSIPLFSNSIWGRVKKVISVGESTPRGNLHHSSTRDPKIFTIHQAPLNLSGSSFAAPRVSADLANLLEKKKPQDFFLGLSKCRSKISKTYKSWNDIYSCYKEQSL